jgi:hypothetical protein
MGLETVEDENMWTTNEGEKFTREIRSREILTTATDLSITELRAFTRTLEA